VLLSLPKMCCHRRAEEKIRASARARGPASIDQSAAHTNYCCRAVGWRRTAK